MRRSLLLLVLVGWTLGCGEESDHLLTSNSSNATEAAVGTVQNPIRQQVLITTDDGVTPATGGEDEIWVYPTFGEDDPTNVQWALDNVAYGGKVKLMAPVNPNYDPGVPYEAFDIRCHPRIPFFFGLSDQVWAWQAGTITGEDPTGVGAPDSDAGTWYTTIVGGCDALSVYNGWDEESAIAIRNISFRGYGHYLIWGAIWLQDSHDVTVSYCRFEEPRNLGDYAIGFNNDPTSVQARGGTITFDHNVIKQFMPTDVFVDTIMFAFLGFYVMSDVEITDNYIEATSTGLFNHEANPDGVARDLRIRNNTIHLISGSFMTDGGAIASGDSYENRYIEDNEIYIYPSRSGKCEISAAISLSNPDGYDNESTGGVVSGNLIDLSARLDEHFPDLSNETASSAEIGSCSGAISLWQPHREFPWSPLVAPIQNLDITGNTIVGSGAYGISIPDVEGPIPNEATNVTIADNNLSGFTLARFNPDYDLYCEGQVSDRSDPPMPLAAGRFGHALSFSGSDYVVVPDPGDDSDLDITDAIAIAAWVNFGLDEFTNLWPPRILTKPHESFSEPWEKYTLGLQGVIDEHPGAPTFQLDLGGGIAGVYAEEGIGDETWHHVAGTYDGSTLRLYVDGELVSSASASGQIATNNLPLYLGQDRFGDGSVFLFFTGLLDDVALWNRALDDGEVRALAGIDAQGDSIAPVHPDGLDSTDGLVLYLPGDTLTDQGQLQVSMDWSDAGGAGLNPGYVNPHFCADPPPRTLDGRGHVWIGAAAHGNTIARNRIGSVARGFAGVVCDGAHNKIMLNDYRQSGIPGWTSSDELGCVLLGAASRSNLVNERYFPTIDRHRTTVCDQILDLGTAFRARDKNIIHGAGACLNDHGPAHVFRLPHFPGLGR